MEFSPSGDYDDCEYSYRTHDKCRMPVEVMNTEDEELMAEWIAKWCNDADDIEITGYSTSE